MKQPFSQENAGALNKNYHETIADLFIRLRGRSLSLAPLDVQMIDDWHKRGIPLHLVVNTIEDVVGNHRGKRIRSITYCADEVEARFAELLEGHVGCGGCEKSYCSGRQAA